MRAGAALSLWALAACLHPPPPPVQPTAPAHVEPELVGVVHLVKRGETLYRIARAYGMDARELMEVNGISDPRALEIGLELFVPGATEVREVTPLAQGSTPAGPLDVPAAPAGSAPRSARARGGTFRWPLEGVLYSRFGLRQGQRHDGIDIAAPEGTPVGAAAEGKVVYAGRQAGYGEIVIVRHAADLLTVYAHASALLVHQGEEVAAGQPIAKVGRSGRTTGPHLHFEVREGTRPRDPLLYLR